jgi:hypothetical protein
MRDNLLNKFMIFISDSKLQQDNPIEWFWHAKHLIDIARSSQGDERRTVIEALGYSRSPILYLYIEIERLKDQH